MHPEDDWDTIRGFSARRLSSAGRASLRNATIFGIAAIALAILIVPLVRDRATSLVAQNRYPAGVDQTATGSIGYRGQYRVRRSILQTTPEAVCIIRDNGTSSGDC